jgi:hypothetical protein
MKTAPLLLTIILVHAPTMTLRETLAWLSDCTVAHGSLTKNHAIVQTTRLTSVERCSVQPERLYPHSKGHKGIRRETIALNLGDFDSTVHVQATYGGANSWFVATIERSDGREAVESVLELKNRTSMKRYRPDVRIFMDSQDSLNQFAKVLSHAIALCGGKPA